MRNKRMWKEIRHIMEGTLFSLVIFWLLLAAAASGNSREPSDLRDGIIGRNENWEQAAATVWDAFPEENSNGQSKPESDISELTPSESDASEPTPSEPEISGEATILAVGDNLMHASVSYSGLQADGSWNFDHLFAPIGPDLQSADVKILCQEVILGGLDLGISGYPNFNTVQEVGHSIVNAGFNVVASANNHTMDKGADGILRTIRFWNEQYPQVCVTGIHESKDDQDRIRVIDQEGIRIAILNYTYGLNGYTLPAGQEYLVDLLQDTEKIQADIQTARANADFVIVMPHWGTEYSYDVNEQQQNLVRMMANLGVDLVIGSHPHVVQPVQWVDREGYERPMLVYYSLGNFVSIQDKTSTMLGGMANITIRKENGETYITDHSLKLLVTHYEVEEGNPYFTNVTTYPLDQYTPQLAERHGIRIAYDPSFSYEAIVQNGQWLMGRVE